MSYFLNLCSDFFDQSILVFRNEQNKTLCLVLYLTGEGLSLKSPGNKHGEGCRKNASNKNRSRRTKVDQCIRTWLFIGVAYLIVKWFPKYVCFFLLTFYYYRGTIIVKKWVFYWVMSSDWKRVLVSFFMFIISYRYILPSFACRITIITLKTLYLSISPTSLNTGKANLDS